MGLLLQASPELGPLAHARALWVFLVNVLFEQGGIGKDQAALTARDTGRDFDPVVVAQVVVELLCATQSLAAEGAAGGAGRRLMQLLPMRDQFRVVEKLGAADVASDVGLLSHPARLSHASPQ
jgi:hypothetical protein